MTFTVEDGSGVTDANSYLSIAGADAFHSDRGNAAWTGTDAVKQVALIKATDYITQTFDGRWAGCMVAEDQSLAWPRAGVDYVDNDVIPKALKQAVAILALEALSDDLNPNLERGNAIKREKVDVIETEYYDWAPSTTVRPAINGLLSRYLTGSGINASVVRV